MSCGQLGCLIVAVLLGLPILIGILRSGSTTSTGPSPSLSAGDYSGSLWKHKAVPDEKLASKLVGGFSSEDARLYHLGLGHIANEHEKIGSFTIGQVASQEDLREQARVAAAEQAKAQAAQAAADQQAAEERHFIHGTPDCLVLDNRTLSTESGDAVWYILGKVTNQCNQDFSYVEVEIGFLDSSGNLVTSGLVNVNNLQAGQSWSFRKAVYEDTSGSDKWRIEKITGF